MSGPVRLTRGRGQTLSQLLDWHARHTRADLMLTEKPLAPRVHTVAVHRMFVRAILAEEKTLEVRGRRWPYAPGWLALYATAKLGRGYEGPELDMEGFPGQAVVGMVWVSGSRRMTSRDAARACVSFAHAAAAYEEPHVWVVEDRIVLGEPIPLVETGWSCAPQNIVGIAREKLFDALQIFLCAECGCVVSWEDGAADTMPEACSACWLRAYEAQE